MAPPGLGNLCQVATAFWRQIPSLLGRPFNRVAPSPGVLFLGSSLCRAPLHWVFPLLDLPWVPGTALRQAFPFSGWVFPSPVCSFNGSPFLRPPLPWVCPSPERPFCGSSITGCLVLPFIHLFFPPWVLRPLVAPFTKHPSPCLPTLGLSLPSGRPFPDTSLPWARFQSSPLTSRSPPFWCSLRVEFV